MYKKNDTFTIKPNCNNIIEFHEKVQNKSSFINKIWIYLLEVIIG